MNIRYDQDTMELRIKGNVLTSDDGETYFVEKALLQGIRLEEMPEGVYFEICDRIDKEWIFRDTIIPYRVHKIGETAVQVVFEDLSAAGISEDPEVFLTRMRVKRDLVNNENTALWLEQYEEKQRYVYMRMAMEVSAPTFDGVLSRAEDIAARIQCMGQQK